MFLKFKTALLLIGLFGIISISNTPIFSQNIASAKSLFAKAKLKNEMLKPNIVSLKPNIASDKSIIASATKNTVLLMPNQASEKPKTTLLTPNTPTFLLQSAWLTSYFEIIALQLAFFTFPKEFTASPKQYLASPKEFIASSIQVLVSLKTSSDSTEQKLASTQKYFALQQEVSDSPFDLPASQMSKSHLFIKVKKQKTKAIKINKVCIKNIIAYNKIGNQKDIETHAKLFGYGKKIYIRSPTWVL
ncbi:MAG: hypothetical protein Q8K70_04085 [Bacteroidota bacterium]|nr:hypothetical protein [Bacteroidota bacterium]